MVARRRSGREDALASDRSRYTVRSEGKKKGTATTLSRKSSGKFTIATARPNDSLKGKGNVKTVQPVRKQRPSESPSRAPKLSESPSRAQRLSETSSRARSRSRTRNPSPSRRRQSVERPRDRSLERRRDPSPERRGGRSPARQGGRPPERRGKSVERRGKSPERRARSPDGKPRVTPFDDRFFCEEVPAPVSNSKALWPKSPIRPPQQVKRSTQATPGENDTSARSRHSVMKAENKAVLPRPPENDIVLETPIEAILINTPAGHLTAGILVPKSPNDKSPPKPNIVDPSVPTSIIPKMLPKGKNETESMSSAGKPRMSAFLDKSSSFYKECINLSFSNSILASESTMATPAISNRKDWKKPTKIVRAPTRVEESSRDSASKTQEDVKTNKKLQGAMEKESWQEVVDATKLLDQKFEALGKVSRTKSSIPADTLEEINSALATIKKHASGLKMKDQELVAAIKGDKTANSETRSDSNAPRGTSIATKPKTWIDMIDFYYCSPLEGTFAHVLIEEGECLGARKQALSDSGGYFVDGREAYSF